MKLHYIVEVANEQFNFEIRPYKADVSDIDLNFQTIYAWLLKRKDCFEVISLDYTEDLAKLLSNDPPVTKGIQSNVNAIMHYDINYDFTSEEELKEKLLFSLERLKPYFQNLKIKVSDLVEM